jgi:hypothetical protein
MKRWCRPARGDTTVTCAPEVPIPLACQESRGNHPTVHPEWYSGGCPGGVHTSDDDSETGPTRCQDREARGEQYKNS